MACCGQGPKGALLALISYLTKPIQQGNSCWAAFRAMVSTNLIDFKQGRQA